MVVITGLLEGAIVVITSVSVTSIKVLDTSIGVLGGIEVAEGSTAVLAVDSFTMELEASLAHVTPASSL